MKPSIEAIVQSITSNPLSTLTMAQLVWTNPDLSELYHSLAVSLHGELTSIAQAG